MSTKLEIPKLSVKKGTFAHASPFVLHFHTIQAMKALLSTSAIFLTAIFQASATHQGIADFFRALPQQKFTENAPSYLPNPITSPGGFGNCFIDSHSGYIFLDGGHRVDLRIAFVAPEEAREIISPLCSRVLRALQSHDMNSLSRLVHPVKGVRFAPYAFLESDTDVHFSAGTIRGAFADQRKRVWGAYDGSGDPIRLSFPEYYQRFVYDRDFARVAKISYNSEPAHQGNTIDNSRKEYPNAIIVEAYDPGEAESNNWRSLRLVFEQHSGTWYLVYIVHDEWTI